MPHERIYPLFKYRADVVQWVFGVARMTHAVHIGGEISAPHNYNRIGKTMKDEVETVAFYCLFICASGIPAPSWIRSSESFISTHLLDGVRHPVEDKFK